MRWQERDSDDSGGAEEGGGESDGGGGDPVQDFLGKGPLHSMLGGGGGGKGKAGRRGPTLVSKDGVSELSVGSGHGPAGEEGGGGEEEEEEEEEEEDSE